MLSRLKTSVYCLAIALLFSHTGKLHLLHATCALIHKAHYFDSNVRAQSFRTCIHSRAEFYVRAYNSGLVRVACWRNGESVDLPLERSRVRISTVPLSGNNFGQVIHKRVSVTKQYHLVPVKGR